MIEQKVCDGVAVVTLARPPVNALDLPTVLALEAVFAQLAVDGVRGLVLAGAGGVFSAGVDTRAFAGYGGADKAALIRAITRMIWRLYALPFPTVAAVSGHAMGGGLVLALGCDVQIAASGDARLGLTEARAGVPFPAGSLEVIRAELSPELLRRLTLTSAVLGPDEFLAHGVLDQVVAADELEARALATVATLASQPAFAAVKQQLRAPMLERLERLAASGDDPMVRMFNEV